MRAERLVEKEAPCKNSDSTEASRVAAFYSKLRTVLLSPISSWEVLADVLVREDHDEQEDSEHG